MAPQGDKYSLARAFEGRSFGAYRIARAIATGGMATVFLARRTGPGRFTQTAALKVIHPHLSQEKEFVEMFLEEARIASSINHPNVCRVLDFGQAEGTFYLAMEYVRGETWAQSLERLTARRESRVRLHALSTYVIAQACEGLHAVHEAVDASGIPLQIVHRDVSPQNLFIAYDGSVRVLDFGIASAGAGDRVQGSTTQVIKGRYAYMAPEQARGTDVDRRADIWSLGVCLREALSNERLFERDTQVATILAVTKEPLPAWPKQVPLLLREICDRALAREPEARFATARELGSALGRFSASEAEPAGGAELGRWMRTLFPEQIAQKRAELRELADEDANTGTFTSIMPLAASPGEGVASELRQTPARGNLRTSGLGKNLVRWGAACVLSVGAAYAAFRLTPQLLPDAAHAPQPALSQSAGATQPAARPGALAAVQPAVGPDSVLPAEPLPAAQAQSGAPGSTLEPPVPPVEASGSAREKSGDAAETRVELSVENRRLTRAQRRQERARLRALAAVAPAVAPSTRTTPPTAATASSAPVEARAESRAPGTLIVGAASGWAEVSLAGKPLGTTPFRIELPVGSYRLDVRFFGTGSPQPVQVEIKSGAVSKLRLTQ